MSFHCNLLLQFSLVLNCVILNLYLSSVCFELCFLKMYLMCERVLCTSQIIEQLSLAPSSRESKHCFALNISKLYYHKNKPPEGKCFLLSFYCEKNCVQFNEIPMIFVEIFFPMMDMVHYLPNQPVFCTTS